MDYLCVLLSLFLILPIIDAACTWPAVFDGTTWLDSQQGQIVFTSSSDVSGFELVFYSQTVNTFTCIEDQFDTNKKLLIRSVSSASALGADWYHYICLKFTELTAGVSYTYYRLNEKQTDAGQHRTKPRLSADAEFTIDNACDETNGAKDAEFVTIIKQGSETDAFITCPSVLLGRFEFNYTNSAGTESCNDPSNQEHMNVCTDKTKLTFDVPCTGQSIVYASGDVYCVASLQVGSDTFVQLYNPQATVDSSSTYRFSCLAISSDSLSSTIVYNNCTNHQTSSYVPRNHNGDVIGASISFLPYVFCKCIKGKFGKDCKDNCPSNCNNEVCNFESGDCIDRCKPGYQGNKCEEKCTIGTFGESCGNNCSGNCEGGDILCRHTDGHCLNGCQTGWNGTNCFFACDEGFHGRNCEERCSEHCATGNRNCNANTGYCEMGCQPGWTGQRCVNACPYGKFGAECKENCASTCKYDVCDHVNGSCHGRCKPGYQGSKCESECGPGTFGENCQEKCSSTCKNGVCGHLFGGCSNGCTPGYHGYKCEEISDNILSVTKPYSGCNETRKLTIALICVGILCACVVVYATVITILFKRKTMHDAKDGSNVSCSGRGCDDATANKFETVTAEAATEAATELARVDINTIDDESHHYTDLTPDTKGVEATYETIQLE